VMRKFSAAASSVSGMREMARPLPAEAPGTEISAAEERDVSRSPAAAGAGESSRHHLVMRGRGTWRGEENLKQDNSFSYLKGTVSRDGFDF
jgi:hypothetical protein